MQSRLPVIVVAALLIAPPSARAQPEARTLFETRCAGCHAAGAAERGPNPEALRALSPQAIIESLVNGAMRVEGARMTGAERRAVAEYLTGRSVGGDVVGAYQALCTSGPSQVPDPASPVPSPTSQDPEPTAAWNGWGATIENTRFQPAARAALVAADLPRLALKWAFGFPDASSAWAQPVVFDGRVFVGGQNGTVYALAAASGCVHWTFAAAGGVRTAPAVGPPDAAGRSLLYVGDTSATAYALDARSGRQVWARRVDDHPLARITGSPVLHDGRLYVPMSSYEEAQGASPEYGCCTFRGSITALDAATGAVLWKTYLIAGEPVRRGTSTAGVALWGPAGSAVWSAPTIDVRRRALYVGTGNAYSDPAPPTSNAVVALDLESGAIRWVRQVTPGDVYLTGCRSGSENANCPEHNGPDHDFGSPPILTAVPGGRDLLVIGQKSGVAFALDPDRDGAIVWQYRAGQGGPLGGIGWGAATDGERAYFAVSDMTTREPGGLHAVTLATGERAWFAPPPPPACGSGRGCNGAQSAAVTVVPGIVLSGSNDGAVRAYSAADGSVLWAFDTNRDFTTVNGVPARGASMLGPGPVVAGGMIFVGSGYGAFGGRAGNVLLAFAAE